MQLTPEQVQSVNILLNAVQVAQRRGAFSLQDAHTLQEAVDNLVPREEQERQAAEALAAQEATDEDLSQVVEDDEDCCDDDESCEQVEDGEPAADSE